MAGRGPRTLVFVDETHLTLSLTPLRGRAPKGERGIGAVPRRRWQSVSFLAALTPTGLMAGVAIPGAVDGDVLTTYLQEALLPVLPAGQVVIWDNRNVHKSATARRLIEAAGCELCFLPRYSPDCNPIELGFSKLKTGVRRAEPRTFDDLITALADGMAAITPTDAAASFAHAGFPLPRQPL